MRLLAERRSVSYAIVFGVWAEVFLYCVVHDQWLIRLAPEHFTVYHPPLWGIGNVTLLALAWAFRASVGPGLILGLAALVVGRGGKRPRVPVRRILFGVVPGIVATEACGLGAGAWSWFTGEPVFPEILYPDERRELLTSQSIQLACYLVGALAGFIHLVWLWRQRVR